MQTELPAIRRRLCSPDPVVAAASLMRLDDLIGLLQRRVRHAQVPVGHRVGHGYIGLSVGRDD